jgi:magnesium-transporting ATPase (P-type)
LKDNFCVSTIAYVDIAMQDPCRPGVKDAVRLCQNAGVKVLFLC